MNCLTFIKSQYLSPVGKILALLRIVGFFVALLFFVSFYVVRHRLFPLSPKARFRVRGRFARFSLFLLGTRLKLEGDPIKHQVPALIVCNHRSLLDPVICASHVYGYYLSKAEVRDYPLIGAGSSLTGVIFVQREDKQSRNGTRKAIADTLREGKNVVLFPEGTTTDGSSVKGFHRKLFRACDYVDCEFQPIVINYEVNGELINPVAFIDDDEFAEHLWHLLSFSHIKARVEFLPVREFSSDNLKQQVNELEQEMRHKVEVRSRKINLSPNGEEIPSPASA